MEPGLMFIELIILKIAVSIDFIKNDKADVGELLKMSGNGLFGVVFEPGNGSSEHDPRFGQESALAVKVREEPSPKQPSRIGREIR
jgi:hypothetical protein